ncbi:putative hemerythrin [Pillotina sp. SPG140]
MAVFNWDDSLNTGHPMIDEQHKQLISAINNFLDSYQRGNTVDEMNGMLDFLNDYTIKHFFAEERLQQRSEYPDHPHHHLLHEGFKTTVRNLKVEFIQRGPSDELMERVRKDIGEWLVLHIKSEDKKLATYLKSRE